MVSGGAGYIGSHTAVALHSSRLATMWLLSTTLANEQLGWKDTRTLDETLATAWAWEKNIKGIKD